LFWKEKVMARPKKGTALVDKQLTRKQQKFVLEWVSNDGLQTKRESAIKAGYPATSAHSRAYELTHPEISPHVCRAIAQYRAELDEKYAVDYKRSERSLQVIRDAALESGAFSASVQAEIARGKLAGLYTSKSEIRTGSIDSMNRQEVEDALRQLSEGLGPIIDITPQAEATPSDEEHRSGVLADIEDEPEEDQKVTDTNSN